MAIGPNFITLYYFGTNCCVSISCYATNYKIILDKDNWASKVNYSTAEFTVLLPHSHLVAIHSIYVIMRQNSSNIF